MASNAQSAIIAQIKNTKRKEIINIINEGENERDNPKFSWYIEGNKVNKSTAESMKKNGLLRLKGSRRGSESVRLDVYTCAEIPVQEDIPFIGKIHPENSNWEDGDRFMEVWDIRQNDGSLKRTEKHGVILTATPAPMAIQIGKTIISGDSAPGIFGQGWIFVKYDCDCGFMGSTGIMPRNFTSNGDGLGYIVENKI